MATSVQYLKRVRFEVLALEANIKADDAEKAIKTSFSGNYLKNSEVLVVPGCGQFRLQNDEGILSDATTIYFVGKMVFHLTYPNDMPEPPLEALVTIAKYTKSCTAIKFGDREIIDINTWGVDLDGYLLCSTSKL